MVFVLIPMLVFNTYAENQTFLVLFPERKQLAFYIRLFCFSACQILLKDSCILWLVLTTLAGSVELLAVNAFTSALCSLTTKRGEAEDSASQKAKMLLEMWKSWEGLGKNQTKPPKHESP